MLCSYSTHTMRTGSARKRDNGLAKVRRKTLEELSSTEPSCEPTTVLALSIMDIAHICTRWLWIIPDCTRLHIPNGTNFHQNVVEALTLYQIAPSCTKLYPVPLVSSSHWFATNCTRLHQIALDSIGLHQIAPQLCQNVPPTLLNGIKLYLIAADCIEL